VTFIYVGGWQCLNFVGTVKHRLSSREELLTEPELLSDWAVQGGLSDAGVDVTDDDLAAAEACGQRVLGPLLRPREEMPAGYLRDDGVVSPPTQ
jgi:hypothetical protein